MKDRERLLEHDDTMTVADCGGPRYSKYGRERRRTKSRLAVMLWMWAVCLTFATSLSYGQCPLHVPSPCNGILNELNSLRAEKNDLSKDLQNAGGGKPAVAHQIKLLLPQIAAKQKELNSCIHAHGGKPDLAATFNGTATMTTSNSNASGPFVQKISIGIVYLAWLHNQFVINNFPPITVGPFDTPAGSNTTTVTLVKSGCGSVGSMLITLNLHFHESLALAHDSDLTITISTNGGSPLSSMGQITLVGDGTFNGGYLDGDSCHLVIKGALLPLP